MSMAVEYQHDFGWTGACIYCGVMQEAIEDNIASPNCDIVRHDASVRTAIMVTLGLIVCAIPLIGMFI